jgi:hypothetical protein
MEGKLGGRECWFKDQLLSRLKLLSLRVKALQLWYRCLPATLLSSNSKLSRLSQLSKVRVWVVLTGLGVLSGIGLLR